MKKEIILKNCIRANEYIDKMRHISDRNALESYFEYDDEVIRNVIINLDPNVINQSLQLETGHMLISLNLIEKIISRQKEMESYLVSIGRSKIN